MVLRSGKSEIKVLADLVFDLLFSKSVIPPEEGSTLMTCQST